MKKQFRNDLSLLLNWKRKEIQPGKEIREFQKRHSQTLLFFYYFFLLLFFWGPSSPNTIAGMSPQQLHLLRLNNILNHFPISLFFVNLFNRRCQRKRKTKTMTLLYIIVSGGNSLLNECAKWCFSNFVGRLSSKQHRIPKNYMKQDSIIQVMLCF